MQADFCPDCGSIVFKMSSLSHHVFIRASAIAHHYKIAPELHPQRDKVPLDPFTRQRFLKLDIGNQRPVMRLERNYSNIVMLFS